MPHGSLDSISQTELWYLHEHPIKEVLNRRFYENISTVCNAVHPKICSENARNVVLGVKNIKPQTPPTITHNSVSLSQQFVRRVDISGRCTKNSSSLNIPFFRSATGQQTFYYRAVSLWNELPENIKCSSSVNIFKHKLRKYLLGNHS